MLNNYTNKSNPLLVRAYNHFKEKNALSPENAILLSEADLVKIGAVNVNPQKFLKLMTFIKNSGDRYWLDESEYAAYTNRVVSWVPFFGVLFFIISLLLIIVALL